MSMGRGYLPFPSLVSNGVAGSVAIVLLYAAIYLKDWASQWLSGTSAIILLVLGLSVGAMAVVSRGRLARPITKSAWLIITVFAVVWVLTLATRGG